MEQNELNQEEVIEKEKESVVEEKTKNAEVVSAENEVLDDDQLYAKIQTEKLLKRKKVRKITTLVSLCFAFVLAVCIIVLAAIPVSLKPRCMADGFSSVTFFAGTTNVGDSFTDDDERFDDFMKVYNKAFSQSYFSAIFSGSLFSYDIDEDGKNVSEVIGSTGELVRNGTYHVRLRYSEPQTFTYQNGKIFQSRFLSSKWAEKGLTFTEVYFVANETEGFQKTEVYIVATYPLIENGVETGTKEYVITLTVKADTNVIYDYMDDIINK